jgi:ribosome-binding factor A
MSTDRITRINELLQREIAEGLFHVLHEKGVDMAAVTVTHVIASRDLHAARVLVSIRADQSVRARILHLLDVHRPELQQRINRDMRLKYTPRLAFELDLSVERGDRVLGILAAMEREDRAKETAP